MSISFKFIVGLTLSFLIFISFGCRAVVHKHPTKSESMYSLDETECRQACDAHPFKGPSEYRMGQEVEFMRECLEDKGWVFSRE